MDNEIQLVSDEDGLAVIGDSEVVQQFLTAQGLVAKEMDLPRMGPALGQASAMVQGISGLSAGSGRWVKLTKESAQAVSKLGLRQNAATGVSTGVLKGVGKGQIGGFVEFARGPVSQLANPALLTGAAGVMSQLAMQAAMDEIAQYLEVIDAKLDDILRAQKDAVLADMIGAGFDIEEALTLREHGGRVNEVTWSKVQATSGTIARTQAYALRQLDALAEKLEKHGRISDLAKTVQEVESSAKEWLAVLARCFQLRDGLAILELDRVMDSAPQDLDGHRLGLKVARQKRLETIAHSTDALLSRMNAAVGAANAKVLFHPSASPTVARHGEQFAGAVTELHTRLGIASGVQVVEAKSWGEAVVGARDAALIAAAQGVDASKRAGGATRRVSEGAVGKARALASRASSEVSDRVRREPKHRNAPPHE